MKSITKIVSSFLVLSLMVLGVANLASAKTLPTVVKKPNPTAVASLAKVKKNPTATTAIRKNKKKSVAPKGPKKPRNTKVKPPKVVNPGA